MKNSNSKSLNDSVYPWRDSDLNESHNYLLPELFHQLEEIDLGKDKRVFELGCGNGSVANQMSLRGYKIVGVDHSTEGIREANKAFPDLDLFEGSAYDNLHTAYGKFPAVVSLEVVEHVYFPRAFAKTAFELLQPGGVAIISTPFHGYWKNLALAITGKMDGHFTALWDHGHIKFWSKKTLRELLVQAGFSDVSFVNVGRVAIFAKSMIAIARKKQ